MREKKEILQVFDMSPVLPATQNDMFRGLRALTEVLCDLRDGLIQFSDEQRPPYKIPPYQETL